MKKLLLLIVLMLVASGTYFTPNMFGASDADLESLVGGATGCECDCVVDALAFFECDHTSMDPNVTCSTEDCLVDYIFFANCPEDTSSNDCGWVWDANDIVVIQEWRNGAPAACNGVDQSVKTFKGQTKCSSGSFIGRCEVASCGGALIDTDVRKGRMDCDY